MLRGLFGKKSPQPIASAPVDEKKEAEDAERGFQLLGLSASGDQIPKWKPILQEVEPEIKMKKVNPDIPPASSKQQDAKRLLAENSEEDAVPVRVANPEVHNATIQAQFAAEMADLKTAYTFSLVHIRTQTERPCDLGATFASCDSHHLAIFALKSTKEENGERPVHIRIKMRLAALHRLGEDGGVDSIILLPLPQFRQGRRSSIQAEVLAILQEVRPPKVRASSPEAPGNVNGHEVEWCHNFGEFRVKADKLGHTLAEVAAIDKDEQKQRQQQEEKETRRRNRLEESRSQLKHDAADLRRLSNVPRAIAMSSNMTPFDIIAELEEPSAGISVENEPLAVPADGSRFYDSSNIDQLVANCFSSTCEAFRLLEVSVGSRGSQVDPSSFTIRDPRQLFETEYDRIVAHGSFNVGIYPVYSEGLHLDMGRLYVAVRQPVYFNVYLSIAPSIKGTTSTNIYHAESCVVGFVEEEDVLGRHEVSKGIRALTDKFKATKPVVVPSKPGHRADPAVGAAPASAAASAVPASVPISVVPTGPVPPAAVPQPQVARSSRSRPFVFSQPATAAKVFELVAEAQQKGFGGANPVQKNPAAGVHAAPAVVIPRASRGAPQPATTVRRVPPSLASPAKPVKGSPAVGGAGAQVGKPDTLF